MRLFKDALMRRSMSAVGALLSPEGEEELLRRTAEVEDAYARVSERAPEELKGRLADLLLHISGKFASGSWR